MLNIIFYLSYWVTHEVLPSIRKTGSYNVKPNPEKIKRNEIYEKNVRNRAAKLWLDLAKQSTTETYKNIMLSYATKELSGEYVIPLPVLEQKTLSAEEVGQRLGLTANKLGRIANANNLKTEENGRLMASKSPHSRKEVEMWGYYETVIPKFKALLGNGGRA